MAAIESSGLCQREGTCLPDLQRCDRTLAPYFAYLEDRIFPHEVTEARVSAD